MNEAFKRAGFPLRFVPVARPFSKPHSTRVQRLDWGACSELWSWSVKVFCICRWLVNGSRWQPSKRTCEQLIVIYPGGAQEHLNSAIGKRNPMYAYSFTQNMIYNIYDSRGHIKLNPNKWTSWFSAIRQVGIVYVSFVDFGMMRWCNHIQTDQRNIKIRLSTQYTRPRIFIPRSSLISSHHHHCGMHNQRSCLLLVGRWRWRWHYPFYFITVIVIVVRHAAWVSNVLWVSTIVTIVVSS